MNNLTTEKLTKIYGKKTALKDVSLTIPRGKIIGLLGPNGAGKSTLLKALTGRILPTSGKIRLDGKDLEDADRGQLFLITNEPTYLKGSRVFQYLNFLEGTKKEFQRERTLKLLENFGIPLKNRFGRMSTGEETLVKVATALGMDVPYLLLDEPVLGLDPSRRQQFYELLLKHFDEFKGAVVIATHLPNEIAGLVEEVHFLKAGEILHSASPDHLRQEILEISGKTEIVEKFLKQIPEKKVLEDAHLGHLRTVKIQGPNLPERLEALVANGTFGAEDLTLRGLTLQEIYIALTGEGGAQ